MSTTFSLPPDLQVGDAVTKINQRPWHIDAKFDAIWKKTTGHGVKIAILDTGYTAHPDLPEPVFQKSYIRGESVADGNAHGTHCAGTALGRDGVGVAKGASLMVGKVLSNSGSGGNDGIARAIREVADAGADVISLSLGGGGFDPTVRDSYLYALDKGCILPTAAGNAGFNGANTIGHPGKLFESLCIGAYGENGEIARYSSGGRELDVACPGSNIVSTSNRGSGYTTMSGTSMATPFMAGLCALIIQLERQEGHAAMKGIEAWRSFLQKFSRDAGAPGRDDRFGFGIPRAAFIVDSLAADDVTMMSVDEAP